MQIASIISCLTAFAPPAYQEKYDNAGLITGSEAWSCTGVLVALDATEEIVEEAIGKKCNLVIAHHPILFNSIKRLNGRNYIEKAIIRAIKHDIAIYAIHTNLDNVIAGVNGRIADQLGLINRSVLLPKPGTLKKLYTFVPEAQAELVRQALFEAGAGQIGDYSEASFNTPGTGTYKAGESAHPFKGELGKRHSEKEIRIEVIFPSWLQDELIRAMIEAHPYEEVAYDIVELANPQKGLGSGLVGELPEPLPEAAFLALLKQAFRLKVLRHTRLTGQPVKKIALCGGAGSFLITNALARKAQFFISSDFKYHEFFDANDQLVIADIGHFESEQFTIDLLHDLLREKFPTFAVLKPDIITNPVHYYI